MNATLPDPYTYPDSIYEIRKPNTNPASTGHDEIITYRKERVNYTKDVYTISWVKQRN